MNDRLRQLVEEWLFREDLKQAQLARRARMAQETLSRILLGKQKPGTKVLRRLEMAMKLEVGTLVELVLQGELPLKEANDGHH